MQRAGRLIGKLKLSPTAADGETRACAAWKIAAGKKIAEHTRPINLVRGTLIVEVEDYTWQRQLNTLRHFLVRNLSDALGEPLVTEIDFRPALAASRKPSQRAVTLNQAMADRTHAMPRRIMPSNIDGIADPVLGVLYRQSQKKGVA